MEDQFTSTVDTTRGYLERLLDKVIDGLPNFIGAIAILIISYIVAKVLAKAVRRFLVGTGLNNRMHSGTGGNMVQRAVPDPAKLMSTIVYWVVYLFGLSIAISVLGIPVLVDFVRAVYGYLPNVFAALLIFLVAGAISAAVAALATSTMGQTATGKILAAAGPTVVMSIAVFMILNQLKIAPEIVTITYAALLGSAALGLALAFGLGGRDVAGRMLQDLYTKSQQAKGQVVDDVRTGAKNAKDKTSRMTNS